MRPWIAVVILLGCSEERALDAGRPVDPYTNATAAECGECHREELREWEQSGHRRSFTNALFSAEHAHRPSRWCTDCHAPRTREEGIDCIVCHVRDGRVVSAEVSGEAPHDTVRDEAFATEEMCARCHEFEVQEGGTLLQRTITEHRASGREETCIDCHMDEGRGHRFGGARDLALLAQALVVEASARIEGYTTIVAVTLRADRVGHAVPTGDIARTLRVCGRSEHAERCVELRRRFRIVEGRRVDADDGRVPPGGTRTVELRLPRAHRVEWSVEMYTAPFQRSDLRRLSGERLLYPIANGTVEASP